MMWRNSTVSLCPWASLRCWLCLISCHLPQCLLEIISAFLSVVRNFGGDGFELVHECIVLVENCVFYFIVRTSSFVAIVNWVRFRYYSFWEPRKSVLLLPLNERALSSDRLRWRTSVSSGRWFVVSATSSLFSKQLLVWTAPLDWGVWNLFCCLVGNSLSHWFHAWPLSDLHHGAFDIISGNRMNCLSADGDTQLFHCS